MCFRMILRLLLFLDTELRSYHSSAISLTIEAINSLMAISFGQLVIDRMTPLIRGTAATLK